MPTSLPKMKLSERKPTSEELNRARQSFKTLAENEVASRKASLRHYLRTNPDKIEKGDDVTMIERFMIMQSRAKDAQKQFQTEKTTSQSSKKTRTPLVG